MERTRAVSQQFGLLRIMAACLALGAAPAIAVAQGTSGTPANQGGPMAIEEEHQGVVFAPEFKISKFDGSTARLAGAYGGGLVGDSVLVGGGIYSLTNGSRGHGLTYGGAVVGWEPWSDQLFGLSLRSLVGFGQATVTDTISLVNLDDRGPVPDGHTTGTPVPVSTVTVARSVDLFVAEPQINLLVRLTKHVHLDLGGGYRLAAASHRSGISDVRFRGASGSIALRIGSAQ
jgi:hypothetical protein